MARKAAPAPGSVLKDKFMKVYQFDSKKLADETGIPSAAINMIIDEKKKITAELAMRLAKVLGTTPKFWLDIQDNFDLAAAEKDSELMASLKKMKKAKIPESPRKKTEDRKPAIKKTAAQKAPSKKK